MKNNMTEIFPTEYKTKDVYIASTLIALGFCNYKIERNGRQCFFVFKDGDIDHPDGLGIIDYIEIQVEKYWNNSLLIDPKSLFNAFKELKTRMFIGGKE